jgi:hypothetical protein
VAQIGPQGESRHGSARPLRPLPKIAVTSIPFHLPDQGVGIDRSGAGKVAAFSASHQLTAKLLRETAMISQRALATNQGTAVSAPAARMGSRKANWALGFAVAGAIGGWLLILPAICSAVAIVLGVAARREIRARPNLKGATKAKAAIFLGTSFTLLWLLLGISLLTAMSSGHVGAYLGG